MLLEGVHSAYNQARIFKMMALPVRTRTFSPWEILLETTLIEIAPVTFFRFSNLDAPNGKPPRDYGDMPYASAWDVFGVMGLFPLFVLLAFDLIPPPAGTRDEDTGVIVIVRWLIRNVSWLARSAKWWVALISCAILFSQSA